MFDISELVSGVKESKDIDMALEFKESDLEGTDIVRLEGIRVKGRVSRIDNDIYHISINIQGNMILLCARSLEEVNYKLDISIDKNIEEYDEEEEKALILQNRLDIFGIVWENIVLEVPIRIIKEDADYLKEGNGWSLEDEEIIENLDSPFSELKTMLDMEGKEWD